VLVNARGDVAERGREAVDISSDAGGVEGHAGT
jgi:hypothetical protein